MNNILSKLILVLAVLPLLWACNDDDTYRPGLYVESEVIECYPGELVYVTGQLSNYVGLASISMDCDAWNLHETRDISAGNPKVYNYSLPLTVPADAATGETLILTVKDKNGVENKKAVLMKFSPDTSAPVFTTTPESEVSVDYNTTTLNAVWALNLTVTDDRALSTVNIAIPELSFNQDIEVKGKEFEVEREFTFTQMGTYNITVTATDASGNISSNLTKLMVMLAEEEDDIQDYAGMYVFDAEENENDYVEGFYRYMDRQGEYQYQGKFYAGHDSAKMLFTPTKSQTGDLYGVSPYVSSKLMNKNGYVVPVTIEKAGYYGVWIDLQAHSVSIWPLDIPEDACTDPLWMSGTGFTFGDWAASDEMTQAAPYRYEVDAELQADYTGDKQMYFYTAGWARVFRADNDGKWWFESASGSCIIMRSDYTGPVHVTYDTAHHWATVKKAQ